MSGLRERKKRDTRLSIIANAVRLFEERGFESASMEEIARISLVSKATLYNYFDDKESILVSHIQNSIGRSSEELETLVERDAPFPEKLGGLIDFVSSFFTGRGELTRIFFRYRLSRPVQSNLEEGPLRSGIEIWFRKLILQGQDSGALRKDIPAEMLTRNLQFLTMSYLLSSVSQEDQIDFELIRKNLISMFLRGAGNGR